MKYNYNDIYNFVTSLPTDVDYHSSTYGRIVIDHDDMFKRVAQWLKKLEDDENNSSPDS